MKLRPERINFQGVFLFMTMKSSRSVLSIVYKDTAAADSENFLKEKFRAVQAGY